MLLALLLGSLTGTLKLCSEILAYVINDMSSSGNFHDSLLSADCIAKLTRWAA